MGLLLSGRIDGAYLSTPPSTFLPPSLIFLLPSSYLLSPFSLSSCYCDAHTHTHHTWWLSCVIDPFTFTQPRFGIIPTVVGNYDVFRLDKSHVRQGWIYMFLIYIAIDLIDLNATFVLIHSIFCLDGDPRGLGEMGGSGGSNSSLDGTHRTRTICLPW